VRKALLSCLLACAAGSFPVAPAIAAAPIPGAANTLTLRLIDLDGGGGAGAPEAITHVGTVSARTGRSGRNGIQVRKRIALRLDGPQPSARVSVALGSEMPGSTVRVDGRVITAIPRLIDPVHRVGTSVVHEIELTIPPSVPAGPFLGNLQWFAETD
jgi:hypothetical protein